MNQEQQMEESASTEETSPVKVAVLEKALLNPERGDNYKLWEKINNNNTYKAIFIQAAESVHEKHWKELEIAGNFFTYPDATMFVNHLFSLSRTLVPDWDDIRNILLDCQLPGKLTLYTRHGNSMFPPKPLVEEDIEKILAKYDQAQYNGAPIHANNCLNMYLLAGFITALGAAAVAVALTLLSGTVATATAAAGVTAILVGVGLFAFGCSKLGSVAEKPAVAPTL